jgi:hypothetical protein
LAETLGCTDGGGQGKTVLPCEGILDEQVYTG